MEWPLLIAISLPIQLIWILFKSWRTVWLYSLQQAGPSQWFGLFAKRNISGQRVQIKRIICKNKCHCELSSFQQTYPLAIGFSIQIIQIICQSCRTGLYQTAFFARGRFVWMMWNICTKREQIGSLICVKILLLNALTEAPQHIGCLLVHWPEGEETVAKSWKRSLSSSAKQ